MDGNGRWAQQRHMPRTYGHARGAGMVRPLVEACVAKGVKCLTLFAFSTENWQRPQDEVSTLMGLFMQYLEKELHDLHKAGVRLKILGDISAFSPALQARIAEAQAKTVQNDTITLAVAANYGGQWDIVQAAQKWLQDHPGALPESLSAEVIAQNLATADLPELDLLIRTGGERRISNFLLWQAAYAELYFSDVLWPDFDTKQLDLALGWFSGRTRRFGLVDEQLQNAA